MTSRLRFLPESIGGASARAEPVPPTICVLFMLFMNSLLEGAGLEAGEIPCLSFSSLVQGREAEGPS